MPTKWKIQPQSLRSLSEFKPAVREDIAWQVGLDVDDKEDARRIKKMFKRLESVLEAYPFQMVWLDQVRPANQLMGLAQFRKKLDALLEIHDQLDDLTWRELDISYCPDCTWADDRRGALVVIALNRIEQALATTETQVRDLKGGRNQRHRPTTKARDELLTGLAGIFAEYSRDKKTKAEQRADLLKFVVTIFEAAGIHYPKKRLHLLI